MFEILKEIKNRWNDSQCIIIYNDYNKRNEVHMVIPSQNVNPEHIQTFRKNGGPIICTVSDAFGKYIGLPTMDVVYKAIASRYIPISIMNQNFDSRIYQDNFSLSISHVDTINGITDKDRTNTINAIGDFADSFKSKRENKYKFSERFAENFYIPGHIPLITAKLNLLQSKVSITELSLALCEITDQAPSTTFSALLNPKTNNYLSRTDVEKYARSNNIPFIDAKSIINLWRSIKKINKAKIVLPEKAD